MKAMKVVAMKKGAMKKASAMKGMKGMKSMKVAKAMKVMKSMKSAMKKSAVAHGKRAKSSVFRGTKSKTVGGLTKDQLTRSKSGKVVSKKKSALAKKAYVTSGLKKWADACKAARKALGVTGFVAVGGKSAAGKALYAKAKSLL